MSAPAHGLGQTAVMHLTGRRLVRLVALPLLSLPACGSSGPPAASAPDLRGPLVVLAAASLSQAFPAAATAFEAHHRGVHVELSFDGSSKLAASLVEGAPGDVFASADQANLAKVVAAGRAGAGTVFATNGLEIAVATGNPHHITGLSDLTAGSVVLALCADGVPCGTYARQAFRQAGLAVPAAGGEASVSEVLARVRLGEADAGVVYATDVLGAAGIDGVPLSAAEQVVASYPAVALTDAAHLEAAAAFVAFLTTAEAQAILRAHGFGPP